MNLYTKRYANNLDCHSLRIRFVGSYFRTVVLHGCETWTITNKVSKYIILKCSCVRIIIKAEWPDKMKNEKY